MNQVIWYEQNSCELIWEHFIKGKRNPQATQPRDMIKAGSHWWKCGFFLQVVILEIWWWFVSSFMCCQAGISRAWASLCAACKEENTLRDSRKFICEFVNLGSWISAWFKQNYLSEGEYERRNLNFLLWISERKMKLTKRDVSVTIFTKWDDPSKQEKRVPVGKWQCKGFQGSSVGMKCCCLVADEDNILCSSNEWQSHLEGINKLNFSVYFSA